MNDYENALTILKVLPDDIGYLKNNQVQIRADLPQTILLYVDQLSGSQYSILTFNPKQHLGSWENQIEIQRENWKFNGYFFKLAGENIHLAPASSPIMSAFAFLGNVILDSNSLYKLTVLSKSFNDFNIRNQSLAKYMVQQYGLQDCVMGRTYQSHLIIREHDLLCKLHHRNPNSVFTKSINNDLNKDIDFDDTDTPSCVTRDGETSNKYRILKKQYKGRENISPRVFSTTRTGIDLELLSYKQIDSVFAEYEKYGRNFSQEDLAHQYISKIKV